MADPRWPAAEARGLVRMLGAYLEGRASVEDVLAWEAELSLDARAAGSPRAPLDRLSLVGAEVCDGVRDESEFRALAREALASSVADVSAGSPTAT